MTVTHMNTIEAKEEFSELINRVAHQKERIILTRRDKEIAAIVPYEDWLILQASQTQNNLEEAIEALKETRNKGAIDLADAKDELGQ